MNVGDAIWVTTGFLLVSLGAAVLLRRPTLSAGAFGVFATGLGALNATLALDGPAAAVIAENLVIMAGFWTLFLVFPTRLARDERHLLVIAFATGALAGAAFHLPQIQAAASVSPGTLVLEGLYFASYAGIVAGVILFPLRARRLGSDQRAAARSLAILSIGVALFRGFDAATILSAAGGETPLAAAIVPLVVFALPPLLWVLVAARGAHSRLARNTVLAHVAVVLAALFMWRTEAGSALLGLSGALLLGFAVLRGQIQGLDIKVRFAISKSTIAAVFVAVFFIVSEAAQQLFDETTGSAYLGIAAAGALVFVLAPLQRVAERLAEKAIPASEAPRLGTDQVDASYRMVLRRFLQDGELTQEEELALARIATATGLTPEQALLIRKHVQAESVSHEEAGS